MAPLKSSKGKTTGKLISLQETDLLGQGIAAAFSATGGVEVVDGNVHWHVFTTPADFDVTQIDKEIEVLVVAGGGGGGSAYYSGGGGSGGVVHGTFVNGASSTPVTVGAAGQYGGPALSDKGDNGGNSTFGTVTAIGGGGGGSYSTTSVSKAGGSSGGMSGYNPAAAPAVTPQPVPGDWTAYGNVGGAGAAYGSGGGGGAGGVGEDGSSSSCCTGGRGRQFPNLPVAASYSNAPAPLQSTLTSAWNTAVGAGYYAGGGGGAGYSSTAPPTDSGATSPGGGAGGQPGAPTTYYTPYPSGVSHTGGGGGGANYGWNHPTDRRGTSGGSGVVIVRYLSLIHI